MKKQLILLFFMVFFVSSNSFAGSITLKSGEEIQGEILERTSDYVKIDFQGIELTYFLSDIDKINGETINRVITMEDLEALNPMPSESKPSKPNRIEKTKPVAFPKKMPQDITARYGAFLISAIGIAVLFFALLVYVYVCLCLQFIAAKTSTEPVWLAWIPIGNLFLMCKIGDLSYWWLLGFLAGLIPFIGVIATLVLSGYIWYRIAINRNKAGWIGAITCLPLVGLVTMGYLAFSE